MRFSGRRSGLIAKDRLRLLLTSERLDCTPANDDHAEKRYDTGCG